MYIISYFHDYYDSVLSFGIDKSIKYVRQVRALPSRRSMNFSFRRETEKIDGVEIPTLNKAQFFSYDIQEFVVGFCGEVFPFIRISRVGEATRSFYDVQSAVEHYLDHKIPLSERDRWYISGSSVRNEDHLRKFFLKDTWKSLLGEFGRQKCPAFVYGPLGDRHYAEGSVQTAVANAKNSSPSHNEGGGSHVLVLNPRLRDFDFQKIKDPATAFQELSMYISGVLGSPASPMVTISDEKKAEKHGHDGRYSFRKPPGGGRWR